MTVEDATKETERYIDNPGQALSYKIGMIKILDLREKAKKELGPRFDIRDFHDVVLKNGAVPLTILEELVDGYIAAKKMGSEKDDSPQGGESFARPLAGLFRPVIVLGRACISSKLRLPSPLASILWNMPLEPLSCSEAVITPSPSASIALILSEDDMPAVAE